MAQHALERAPADVSDAPAGANGHSALKDTWIPRKPETRSEIQRVLEKVSKEFDNSAPARDYAAAQREIVALHQAGNLGEPELAEPARPVEQGVHDQERPSIADPIYLAMYPAMYAAPFGCQITQFRSSRGALSRLW